MRLEEVKETRRVLSFPNCPACILSMASREMGKEMDRMMDMHTLCRAS